MKKSIRWSSFRVGGSRGWSGFSGQTGITDGPLFYGLVSVFLVTVVSLIFVFRFDTGFWLVLWAAPFSFVSGLVLYFYERSLLKFQHRLEHNVGRIQASALILFVFLIGFIIIFTILFTYPMGLLAGRFADGFSTDQYGRWTINLVILASLACWLRCQTRSKRN